MVMNSTRAVEVSIQAVSPEFRVAVSSWAMARPEKPRDNRAPSPANFRRVMVVYSWGGVGSEGALDRVGTGFAGTDADGLLQVDDKDLAVADLAGIGRLADGLDDAVELVIVDGHVDLHLRQEVDDIFGATIKLGVALLPSEAFNFGDSDALDTDFGQRLADVVQFERLDDGSDSFHETSPVRWLAPEVLNPKASLSSVSGLWNAWPLQPGGFVPWPEVPLPMSLHVATET